MLVGTFTFFHAIWKMLKCHLIAQFGVVNLLCCVPTSCMHMPIVALHWKVGVKLGEARAIGSMRGTPRLFGGFLGVCSILEGSRGWGGVTPTPIHDPHQMVGEGGVTQPRSATDCS